jgi:predicted TPR repeat methyltransferase
MLPARHYGSALDVGCGLGVFTRMLAKYADTVLGEDFSGAAVEQARALSGEYTNVRYGMESVLTMDSTRCEPVDLIALLDVLYYLSPLTDSDLKSIAHNVAGLLNPGGIVLLANHCFFGLDSASRLVRAIHACFRSTKTLETVREEWHPFYLTTVLTKHT